MQTRDISLAFRVRARLLLPVAFALVGLAALAERPADAEDTEPVKVVLVAPAGCSSEDRFFAEVRARTAHVRRISAHSDVLARILRVGLVVRSGAIDGELAIDDPRGSTTRRSLSGETCEAVVSGLALVAALAIDPHASMAPSAVGAGTAMPLPDGSPDNGSDAAAPAFPDANATIEPAAPTETPAEATPAPPTWMPASVPVWTPAAQRSRIFPPWAFTAGVGATALGVAAPGAVLDATLFLDLALDSPKTLSPAFRLSVHRTLDTSVGASDGSGTFAWTLGRAEGCPVRLAVAGTLALRPCALLDAGVLTANGGAIAHPQAVARGWVDLGVLARLQWSLLRNLTLEGDAGLAFPLVRDQFYLHPSTGIYTPPIVMLFAGLGVGVRFP